MQLLILVKRRPGAAGTMSAAANFKERQRMLNLKVVTWALGLTGAVLYLLCIAYGLANPAAGHMREFLAIALPGFEWLTPAGFLIGLVKSFLYGVLAGIVYVPIHNQLARRFG